MTTQSGDKADKALNIHTKGWDLVRAVLYIRGLQRKAHQFGYNLTLGGGVLNNGHSDHDLDIVAIPRNGIDIQVTLSALLTLFNVIEGPNFIPGPGRLIYHCDDGYGIDLIVLDV